jgi:hypothetical protein
MGQQLTAQRLASAFVLPSSPRLPGVLFPSISAP